MPTSPRKRTQEQVINRTKTGKALDNQARKKTRAEDKKQKAFASGKKRHTEGK